MLRHLTYFLETLFLFTKSDLWTVMLPITAFSQFLVTTPSPLQNPQQRLVGLAASMLWTWLNLLQFATSNQTEGASPSEDAKNKPYRPIPAKRITLYHARLLRWALIPITLVVSLGLHIRQQHQHIETGAMTLAEEWKSIMSGGLGCIGPCIVIILLTIVHDEFGGHQHWLLKGGTTGIAYASFAWGATCLASYSPTLTQPQYFAIIRSTLIILTTIHAQDFRDVEGDTLLGRTTLPIAYPVLSRISMPLILLGWSIFISFNAHLSLDSGISILGLLARWALITVAAWAGLRFRFLRDAKSDSKSYNMYNPVKDIWDLTAELRAVEEVHF
ncbi:hypothetical protein BT96DRAFT_978499 [Gymnopus androsaceus JB14]|uniref:Barwin domain-containing protein n=1 Tax=Gymnopus androsaceus JB14 TaxID=1447944 RepID=A0A6A4H8A8_9AGAR|nr:hypothetical protein BT96DRAFT_978499 [Gymnopus androsaceus JB14]